MDASFRSNLHYADQLIIIVEFIMAAGSVIGIKGKNMLIFQFVKVELNYLFYYLQ